MIPIHLSVAGFLSYRDPVELDFTKFDLACISGPNGAGKSALLDAITFALFGQARNRGDSLINSHMDVSAAQVELTFAYEGNVYRVQRIAPREKSTILEFHIQTGEDRWKALTERTLRDTEARIQETLRLDYETFVNASFFLQGKADQFTQQRPADRKRILSSVLGLEIWEEYRGRSAERRKSIEDKIIVLQGHLQEIASELDQEEARKARLNELTSQLGELSKSRAVQEAVLDDLRRRAAAVQQQQALAATLAAQLQRTEAQLAELRTRLEERSAEQTEFADLIGKAEEIEGVYAGWQALREELVTLEGVGAKFHGQEIKRGGPLSLIEAERARLETELKTLTEEAANLETLAANKAALEHEHKTLQAEITKLERQRAKGGDLELKLKEERDAQTKVHAENPMLRDEMLALKGKIVQMEEAKGAAACPTCGQPLTEKHRVEVIEQLSQEGKKMGDRYRANQRDLQQVDQRVAKLEQDLAGLKLLEEGHGVKTVKAGQLRARIDDLNNVDMVWQQQRAPRLAEIQSMLKTEGFASDSRAELGKIDAELKATGYDAARHDATRRQELAARPAEAQMRALEQARAAAKPLDREIKDLAKQIAAQDKERIAQEAAHQQAAKTLEPMQEGLPDLEQAERAMLDTQEKENQVREALGAAQQEVAVLDVLRSRKAEFENQREGLAEQVSKFQALERAFGKDGVPAMLIEQALPQIESKANQILERLSAGSMNIRFVTQRPFKDSKRDDLRETLEIQISDGAGVRDYEMFSGGEAFRINFAIRLALSEVLAQRAGARLQTLVVDEGFGSQDEAGRQRLVEVIGLVRQDFAKVLVITHIDALKDAFPNRIEVEKGPRGSMLRVV
ncbi:MAG TPA: SMC family ATPase [Anaerolineales bacterium]|nr:SMC family ATPase [Anaerolineales bacterium]